MSSTADAGSSVGLALLAVKPVPGNLPAFLGLWVLLCLRIASGYLEAMRQLSLVALLGCSHIMLISLSVNIWGSLLVVIICPVCGFYMRDLIL